MQHVSMKVKKMAHFLRVLMPNLKTILASQDFHNFSHLLNNAIQVEKS
jgi:hypothetical protein